MLNGYLDGKYNTTQKAQEPMQVDNPSHSVLQAHQQKVFESETQLCRLLPTC